MGVVYTYIYISCPLSYPLSLIYSLSACLSLSLSCIMKVRISGLPDRADWRTVKDFLRDQADPAFVDNIMNGEGADRSTCIHVPMFFTVSVCLYLSMCVWIYVGQCFRVLVSVYVCVFFCYGRVYLDVRVGVGGGVTVCVCQRIV